MQGVLLKLRLELLQALIFQLDSPHFPWVAISEGCYNADLAQAGC